MVSYFNSSIRWLRSRPSNNYLGDGFARALLFVGVFLTTALSAVPSQKSLSIDVDLVNVLITVQDPAGRFVTNLNQSDFRVYEDGVEQKLAVFDKEDVDTTVGVLLDNSLSMVDILPMMKTGLLDFAEKTKSLDELFVVTFGTRIRTIHEPPDSLSDLQSNVKLLGAQGTSVLFDALVEGLRKVGGREPERKALLVFTDGVDTGSKAGFKDVLLEAQKAGALIYFIPIGSRVLIDEHTIDSLAKETGGRAIYLRRNEPIRPAMETIRQELARQYYIGYYTSRKPGYHSIRVEVPGRDVRIRAKTGYHSS
ncbi:MAG TPA: VWA domain-containing protein [Terriglobia bacterium]|nr:VWA domain-containing protein [Terriglobia bacterium]